MMNINKFFLCCLLIVKTVFPQYINEDGIFRIIYFQINNRQSINTEPSNFFRYAVSESDKQAETQVIHLSDMYATPEHYVSAGTIQLPYAELNEPFKIFYDMSKKTSRIDMYDGVTKTYHVNMPAVMRTFKIVPITADGRAYNQMTCFITDEDSTAKIQSMLPDFRNFSLAGDTTLNGKKCLKFIFSKIEDNVSNTYTLYILKQTNFVPLRLEMHGYDYLMGSHSDHYIINYDSFAETHPSEADLTPPDVKDCLGWHPGSSEKDYAYAPFNEFVHGESRHVHHAFEHFKSAHGKTYARAVEERSRLHNFRHNMRYINSMNRRNLTYKLAVNHMADMSRQEIRLLNGYRYSNKIHQGEKIHSGALMSEKIPDEFSWRLYGAVTPVKDQAICGSCWSFGTVGAMEGAYFRKYGTLRQFSEQALVDCSWGQENNGCDGGVDVNAYAWIKKHGLPTTAAYGPYKAIDSFCHANTSQSGDVKMNNFYAIDQGDIEMTRRSLYKLGPLSVAIDANHLSFMFYSHGVYYNPICGNQPDSLDHAVLLTGYGTLNGEPYWLVKNSWSTHWGNDGYILMSRRQNNCGVATAATFPQVI